jgi:hypothetical protein
MTDQDGGIPHPANDEDSHNNYTLPERLTGALSLSLCLSLDLPQTVRSAFVTYRRHHGFPQIPPQMANFMRNSGIKLEVINVDALLFFLSHRFWK